MNIQEDQSNTKKQGSLCKECALFYGNQAFDGLCSTCHKKSGDSKTTKTIEKSPAITLTPTSTAQTDLLKHMEELTLQPTKIQQKDKKRCFNCSKKTGMLGIECKCGYVFCNSHRLPQNHKCEFNFKQNGIEKLKKQVFKVQGGKILEI